jgi:RNA polymerase sigma-70 factor (ECF subfamily)
MTPVEVLVAEAYRRHWAGVLATVVGLTRDLDAAEDAVQDAFAAALPAWQHGGVPDNPVAWLTTTARRKALDRLRRDQTLARKLPLLIVPDWSQETDVPEEETVTDTSPLRLIFTCCHPALAMPARVALTLRLICGLSTPEIARLFLVPEATVASRISRAKQKIRAAGIAYRVPADHELTDRLPAVLAVIYLLFTEGHTATQGAELHRGELARRAVDLARDLAALMPDEAEVIGLLALLCLANARQPARLDEDGGPVLLADQDRGRWDPALTAEGLALVARALKAPRPGPYALQAAIAAVHAEAPSYAKTDWPQILALYDALLAIHPSPVTRLGRAMALAMVAGPPAGLAEIDRLADEPTLARSHLVPAARAELLLRLGERDAASAAFRRAAAMTGNEAERSSLLRRANSSTTGSAD